VNALFASLNGKKGSEKCLPITQANGLENISAKRNFFIKKFSADILTQLVANPPLSRVKELSFIAQSCLARAITSKSSSQ
jgi:hypothetical protein